MGVIWAIARTTILMTIRRKAPIALVLLVVIGGPLLSPFLEGDNTLIGFLRLVVTYNFMIASGLLMALMLYLSATVLNEDLVQKQIQMVDVKPVPRWQLLFGKWLGLVVFCAWLLLMMGSLLYILLVLIASPVRMPVGLLRQLSVGGGLTVCAFTLIHLLNRKYWKRSYLAALPHLAGILAFLWLMVVLLYFIGAHMTFRVRSSMDYMQAHQQFLVSRTSYKPELPSISEEIAKYRQRLEESDQLAPAKWDPMQLEKQIREVLNKKLMPIPYQAGRTFYFKNLPTVRERRGVALTVRYKIHGSRLSGSVGWMQHLWVLRNPVTGLEVPHSNESKSGKVREFMSSTQSLGEDGTLELTLINAAGPQGEEPPVMMHVPLDDGIEVLIPSGSFEGNYIRAFFLLWIRLAMIAAIGVAANAFLSGPVTAFLVFGLLVVGMLNSFVLSTVAPRPVSLAATQETKTAWEKSKDTAKHGLAAFLLAMPNFDQTAPAEDLYVGREISLGRLLIQALYDLVFRAGVIVVLGVLWFYRREVGLPVTS